MNTAALGNRQLPTCSTSARTKYRGVASRLLHVFPHRKNEEERGGQKSLHERISFLGKPTTCSIAGLTGRYSQSSYTNVPDVVVWCISRLLFLSRTAAIAQSLLCCVLPDRSPGTGTGIFGISYVPVHRTR